MTRGASFDCAVFDLALRMRRCSQWHLPHALLGPPHPERARQRAVEGRTGRHAAVLAAKSVSDKIATASSGSGACVE